MNNYEDFSVKVEEKSVLFNNINSFNSFEFRANILKKIKNIRLYSIDGSEYIDYNYYYIQNLKDFIEFYLYNYDSSSKFHNSNNYDNIIKLKENMNNWEYVEDYNYNSEQIKVDLTKFIYNYNYTNYEKNSDDFIYTFAELI